MLAAEAIAQVPEGAAPSHVFVQGGVGGLATAVRARLWNHYGADLTARLTAAGFLVSVLSSKRLLTPHRRRRYRINRNYLFFCRRTENSDT